MLTKNKKGHPIIEAEASVPYELATGPSWHRFFEGFKNEKIYGSRCPQCQRVLVPARSFCPRCFVDMGEWIEVSNEGEVVGWSLTNYHFFGMPTEPPFISGLIRLDGADNDFYHLVGGFDLKNLELVTRTMKIGTRVKAVWKEKKQGCIMDIKYFRPTALADQTG